MKNLLISSTPRREKRILLLLAALAAASVILSLCVGSVPLSLGEVCSVITGLFTGLCAQILVNRGKDLWKITSK